MALRAARKTKPAQASASPSSWLPPNSPFTLPSKYRLLDASFLVRKSGSFLDKDLEKQSRTLDDASSSNLLRKSA
jgi:hypothetical protein